MLYNIQMATTFDYEFVFPSGSFDQTVYDACTIPDTLGRQALVETTISEIQNLFNNTVLNLHRFSTFVEHDTKTYKITVTNPAWGS
jgi:hypothetical protein